AHLGDLGDEVGRELLLLEELGRPRQVALLHEAADGVADHPLLLGEERVDGHELVERERFVGAHGRALARRGPARKRYGCVWTSVPFRSDSAPCQAAGTSGVVQPKSQAASMGARFTQPWLRGVPKSSCQYAAWSAKPSVKYWTKGTSRKSNSSPILSSSIVTERCFVWMRNAPWMVEWVFCGSPSPPAPVETGVTYTGFFPS